MDLVTNIIIIALVILLLMYVFGSYTYKKGINPMADMHHHMRMHRHMPESESESEFAFALEYPGFHCKHQMDMGLNRFGPQVENMAPLDFGTYYNPYPRGECNSGDVYARSDCMIGNCDLKGDISDDEYCKLQCAQDPDPMERRKCYERCIDTMC